MEPRGIHHLGVAVDDLDQALATYERLFGARLEHRETVPEQGVEAASMRIGGDRVELLASLGEETPVGKFLASRGPGMHHLAIEVENVGAALDELAAGGAELVDERPRRGLFGLEVAFVHPDGGQVMGAVVDVGAVDELERSLGQADDGGFAIESEDGRYTISLRRIVYVKRFTREA